MAKLNMANINTLFRKGYLLAGVVMAANMFVVNEVKASENKDENNPDTLQVDSSQQLLEQQKLMQNPTEGTAKIEENNEEKGKNTFTKVLDMASGFVLSRENTINLIGGVVFSGANNYLKWWDYNPGSYCNLRNGCLGWRSKKFFDTVQLDFNLNLWRGIGWLIPGIYNFIKGCIAADEKYIEPLHFSFLVATNLSEKKSMRTIALILSFLFQGFVSVPLAIHISNFSISISLDSMLWAGIGKILELKVKEELEY